LAAECDAQASKHEQYLESRMLVCACADEARAIGTKGAALTPEPIVAFDGRDSRPAPVKAMKTVDVQHHTNAKTLDVVPPAKSTFAPAAQPYKEPMSCGRDVERE
jgi:hypothetical protein